VETVSIEEPAAVADTATDAGLKEHEASVGRPVQESATCPLNPVTAFTLSVVETDCPEATVRAAGPDPLPTVISASTA
jgi:hypothetical protein